MTHRPSGGPSNEARRRVLRAALLRPLALMVLAIGTVFFAITLTWWAIPLTLATYAALVVLAVRDPIFRTLVLEGREKARLAAQARFRRAAGATLETRVRRLPHGEGRSNAEATLQARDRLLLAIEEAGEPTRDLLAPLIPEVQRTAALLVDLAETRESLPDNRSSVAPTAVDEELDRAPRLLRDVRSEVVRASIETDEARADRARDLEETLRETNRRLRELNDS